MNELFKEIRSRCKYSLVGEGRIRQTSRLCEIQSLQITNKTVRKCARHDGSEVAVAGCPGGRGLAKEGEVLFDVIAD